MTRHILTFLLFFAGFAYAQPTANRLITIQGSPCVAGELLVCFIADSADASTNQNQFRRRMIKQNQVRVMRRFQSGAEHWRINRGDLIRVLDSLNQHPDIKYAEPNYILSGDLVPDDPAFSQQWALLNNGQSGGTEGVDIAATAAWDISIGSADILVGIVDSGIDYDHPDLSANIWINPAEIAGNEIDDDGNGFVDDYYGYDFLNELGNPIDEHGHGTHVSGIIGAIGNNGTGICGIAWNVRLLPLKFLGPDNSGPVSAAIVAIEYAISAGVDFINASWGSTVYSQTLKDVLQQAAESDILCITSAGNESSDNDFYPHYPSDLTLDHILSVGATDHNDQLSSFSNWGLNAVDLAAPGTDILSTLPDSSYGTMSGTSMAAPHVTAALVLARTVFPEMTALQLKEQILNSVQIIPDFVGLLVSAGRLHAGNALGTNLLADLSGDPGVIDFGIELIGQSSETEMVYIENRSQQTINIDSIIVADGYEISYNDGFSQRIEPFQIAGQHRDSIQVRFLPHFIADYKRLLTIYYRTSTTLQKNCIIQLLGRGVNGTILEAGAVWGTWRREEGPFYIEGDIFIPAANSLYIEPGTRVQFEGHYAFTVAEGAQLDSRGTDQDTIVFTASDKRSGWNGLRLINSGDDDILSFCRFEFGLKFPANNLEDERGGALYCLNSTPLIENSLFQDNRAESGGAICLSASPVILNNVNIINNRAGLDGGGGISCYDSDPQLFRVVISHNRTLNWFLSGDNGGGIYCKASSPQLLNVTISQNWAGKGGGLYIAKSSENLSLVNSILWGNLPNQIELSGDSREKSIAISHSDLENGLDGIIRSNSGIIYDLDGNLAADPLFQNDEDGDFRLGHNSPCIDAGIQDTIISYNSAQNTITIPSLIYNDTAPDLGAIEFIEIPFFNLPLRNGWNLIGWNNQTEPVPPAQRFQKILAHLDVVLSFEKIGLTFDPLVDDLYNTLLSTDNRHGYWLRMNSADNLLIKGEPVELPASITLEQGWNLISYLPQFPDSTRLALKSIIENVIIVEAFDGGALTFDPYLSESINTLHLMIPGYGYWIKVSEKDTLIFYEKDIPNSNALSLATINNLYLPSEKVIQTNEWINVFASSTIISGELFDQDLKVFARDPDGILCGEMEITENGYFTIMPIYRDDSQTEEIDEGAQPGDLISLFVNSTQLPFKLEWQHSGQIVDISDYITTIDIDRNLDKPLSYILRQNFPNPFNNQTIIKYQIPLPGQVRIDIYNVLGQKVRELVNSFLKPDYYKVTWDGKNQVGVTLASGIYYCRMKTANYIKVIKIIRLN